MSDEKIKQIVCPVCQQSLTGPLGDVEIKFPNPHVSKSVAEGYFCKNCKMNVALCDNEDLHKSTRATKIKLVLEYENNMFSPEELLEFMKGRKKSGMPPSFVKMDFENTRIFFDDREVFV